MRLTRVDALIGRIWLTAKNSIFYSGRKIKGQKNKKCARQAEEVFGRGIKNRAPLRLTRVDAPSGRIWLTAKNSIFYSGRKIKGQKIRSAPGKPKDGLQICNGSGCRSSHPQSGNLNTSYIERIQQPEMTVKQKEKEKGNVSRPLFTACGDDRRFPQTFSEKKIRQPTTAVKQNHHFGKRQGCAEHIYQTDANELKGIKKSSAAAGLCAVGKRVPTMLRFTATCTYILFVCLRFVKFSCIHKYYALRRADHCSIVGLRESFCCGIKNKTGRKPCL